MNRIFRDKFAYIYDDLTIDQVKVLILGTCSAAIISRTSYVDDVRDNDEDADGFLYIAWLLP